MYKKEIIHFYWLDLLRFIAALIVVICHFRGAFFVEYSLLPKEQQGVGSLIFYFLTRLGHESVLIFFVLSGFLVGGKAFERMNAGNFQVGSYCIDRFTRIMLPLIASLLLYIPVTLFIGKNIDWISWFGSLLSLQGILTTPCIEPLWSLAYEVWFYIIIVAIYLILSQKSINKYGIFILFICFLIFTKLMPHYLFIWLLGAMAYLIRPRRFKYSIMSCSILGILTSIILLQLTSNGHYHTDYAKGLSLFNREMLEIIYSMFCCIFIQQLITLQPKHPLSSKIDKAGTILASFSYTLYLTHVLVLRTLEFLGAPKSETLNTHSLGLWLIWIFLALGISYILYLGFEKHTKPVKQFLKEKLLK